MIRSYHSPNLLFRARLSYFFPHKITNNNENRMKSGNPAASTKCNGYHRYVCVHKNEKNKNENLKKEGTDWIAIVARLFFSRIIHEYHCCASFSVDECDGWKIVNRKLHTKKEKNKASFTDTTRLSKMREPFPIFNPFSFLLLIHILSLSAKICINISYMYIFFWPPFSIQNFIFFF